MSGEVRPHPLDSTLDTDTLQIIGPHTNKSSPNPRLSVYLIVRDVCQVCSEVGAGGIVRGNEGRSIDVGHDLTEGIVELVGGGRDGRRKVCGAIHRG